MSFPAYPIYKYSGVEWIGEIPDHWSASPLKRAFKIEGGSTPPPDEANWDGDIAWVTPADLSDLSSLFLDASKRTITARGLSSCGTTLLPAGSLILSTRAPIGSLAIGLIGMCTNQGCKGLVPNANVSSAYFALVLLTAKGELNNRGRGSTFLEISGDELSRFSVPTPSFAEQTQIARFLDHETARIDALIEEQQRLIELLKEKRQAVISHAVTKGLDPTVSMKDSGVEWLGEVPAHWVVKSMKRLVEDGESVSYGIVQPGDHKDEGVPFIQTTNMSSGDFSFDALQRTSPEIEANYPRSRLHGGEVILGIRATIGAAFVIPESLKNINLSRGVARIECSEQVLAGYLVYFLSGRAAFEYWGLAKQGSTFSEVSIATVRELPVTVPPLIEQQELIDHMEQGTKRLDDLTLTGERTMALLRERRSALISAAVTGKIDVRGWKPPTSALSPELEKEAV
jgi:type I restriction enzyme S subunit